MYCHVEMHHKQIQYALTASVYAHVIALDATKRIILGNHLMSLHSENIYDVTCHLVTKGEPYSIVLLF